ncbi:MAG: hypothetical protein FD180_2811 [Planctomycetota bacterium]|nr:MAG: hypothetical protein FD180_2811 [Planctomycetota bacterium]
MAARRDFALRVKQGRAPKDLNFILGDPEIPEEIRFEVWLLEAGSPMRPFRRMLPFAVFLSRTAAGRNALRRSGGGVVPAAERKAWEAWSCGQGPRPDGKPEEAW